MPTPITPLPDPPQTTDPNNFAAKSDALLAALPQFVEELNALSSLVALGVTATSTTSVALGGGPGLKTFTVQTGKGYVAGMDVVAAVTADPTTRMLSVCNSYNSATGELVLDVYDELGTPGTYAAWTFSVTAAVDTDNFVTPDGTQTLTNKTLTSPVMTGTPTAPTAAANDSTTKVATTAYVQGELADMAPLDSPALTGTPTAPTQTAGNNTTRIATTAFVQQELTSKANLASPTFTGTPAAPTAAGGTNTTQIATTAFVKAAIDALVSAAPGALDTLNELAAALGDDPNFASTMTSALAAKAALASPAFTGNPTAPTQAAGNNSTRLATTAFVQQEIISGKKTFTADGAITSGEVVVLTAAGEVAPVASSLSSGTLGSEQVHLSAATTYYGCIAVPGANQWVLLYTGFLVVAELDVGAGTLTFGTPVAFSYASTAQLAWHATEGLLISYTNGTMYLQIGTISGTTLTLGTASSSGTTVVGGTKNPICYQTHQNKAVVFCRPTTSSLALRSAHIAGGVITWQANQSVASGASAENISIAEIPGTPYFLIHKYSSALNSRIDACELNGSSITVGSDSNTLNAYKFNTMVWDPVSSKMLGLSNTLPYYVVITPSLVGISAPSVGSPTALSNSFHASTIQAAAAYDSVTGRLVIYGREASTAYAMAVTATISGNALVESSPTYVNSSSSDTLFMDYNATADRVLFIYQDEGNLDYGTARVWDTGDIVTDADDWIGIAAASAADGASVDVVLKGGYATNLSGLTAGYDYYIEDDGDLTQTVNGRKAGVALSTTSLFITGNM
jgi:hypothetical protein